ncbi:uncharacterized protein TrAtP1_008172 [Trichoderma atroviride]|uniref:uncharacterized protein n=1 Tax=Hypocrea atroviridis TaxID=63577 RepID=UPI00332F6F59|nr:hypothetical protein TrAtP1_008172 [Trichoderma atroviride]
MGVRHPKQGEHTLQTEKEERDVWDGRVLGSQLASLFTAPSKEKEKVQGLLFFSWMAANFFVLEFGAWLAAAVRAADVLLLGGCWLFFAFFH